MVCMDPSSNSFPQQLGLAISHLHHIEAGVVGLPQRATCWEVSTFPLWLVDWWIGLRDNLEEQPPVSWKTPGNPWFSSKNSLQPIDWVSKYQVVFEKIRHVDAAKIDQNEWTSFFFVFQERSADLDGDPKHLPSKAVKLQLQHLQLWMVQKQLVFGKKGMVYHWVDQITIYIYICTCI